LAQSGLEGFFYWCVLKGDKRSYIFSTATWTILTAYEEVYNMDRFDDVLTILPEDLRTFLSSLAPSSKENVHEIRLRTESPIAFSTSDGVGYLSKTGEVEKFPSGNSVISTKYHLGECFRLVCGYSVYSHQHEIRNGFITIKNGHRIGLGGTAVLEKGQIVNVRNVSSINIRIAREVNGSADPIIKALYKENPTGTLIVGAPSSGKTTILRDIARQLSNGILGRAIKVVVVDERGELGAVYAGQAGNHLGCSCDILDNYPKDEGIQIAIRCLSPDVILCDEIGTRDEVEAVIAGLNAGVPIISSIHAHSTDELLKRPQSKSLLETGAFTDIVLLKNAKMPGQVAGYYKVSDLYD